MGKKLAIAIVFIVVFGSFATYRVMKTPEPTKEEVFDGALLAMTNFQLDLPSIKKAIQNGEPMPKMTITNKYTKKINDEKVYYFDIEYTDQKTGQKFIENTLRMVYRGTRWYYLH